jgi:hypothetical protein
LELGTSRSGAVIVLALALAGWILRTLRRFLAGGRPASA